jgi:hypothetical protein
VQKEVAVFGLILGSLKVVKSGFATSSPVHVTGKIFAAGDLLSISRAMCISIPAGSVHHLCRDALCIVSGFVLSLAPGLRSRL